MKGIYTDKTQGILTAACVVLLTGATYSKAEEICPGSPVPKHWAVVDIVTRAGGCTAGHLDEMRKIQNTLPLAVDAEMGVCPESPIPEGWIAVNKEQCAGCCGAAGRLSSLI